MRERSAPIVEDDGPALIRPYYADHLAALTDQTLVLRRASILFALDGTDVVPETIHGVRYDPAVIPGVVYRVPLPAMR